MTSGVYQLNFPGGDSYIGKSINIEERWKQHTNKFYKGTAAKAMQAAFNTYGAPNGAIICECHEDHIDVVEACYISRNLPALNSDRPKDPFPDLTPKQINDLFITFKYSARELIEQKAQVAEEAKQRQKALSKDITKLDKQLHKLYEEVVELTDLNDQLLEHRSEEEIRFDVDGRIVKDEKQIQELKDTVKKQEKELNNLSNEAQSLFQQLEHERLPWWKKLFK